MKEKILDMVKASGKITYEILSKKLDIDACELDKLLLELKLDGKILESSNKYSLFPEDMLISEISLTKSLNKVIFYDGRIIPLASNFFDSVILNDTVSFVINEHGEAVITSIIDRKLHDVTCKVFVDGKKKKIECFHKGIDILIPEDTMKDLNDGDIILVNIGINDVDSRYCKANFKRVIGNVSEANADEIIIAMNYGFDNEYSDEYMEEIHKIPTVVNENDCVNRLDLRSLNFVTIDGIYAKDMDDAVYAEKIKDGYRVYVSISDVSHYVKFDSEIFKRAYEKGNSYYANNTVYHMLHCIISNGICSLNPMEDRLTKTVIMDVNEDGKIIDFNISKSVIRTRKKMTYDDVDKILVDGVVPSSYEPFVDNIKVLHEVAKLFENRAKKHDGKIDFPSTELEKTYDENGNVSSVTDMKNTPSRKLIEYLMVNANKCVASYIYWDNIPSCYRVHDIPDVKKVNDTLRNINESDVGVRFKLIDSADNPKVIQAILHKLSSVDEYPILASMLLQDMQKAIYSVENTGHYALGIESYTHFTSPIRRLCDLLVHMILDLILENYEVINTIDFKKMESFLREACTQASRMERQADAGEYEAERLAIIKSMEKDVGGEFEAVVLEIGDKIKVKVNGIDAFVKYKYLSDNFNYDSNSGRYYDKYNNKVLKIGAKVIVKLVSINLNNRTINLDILGILESKKLVKTR